MLKLSRRDQLALKRFVKVLLAAILPVVVASLQAQEPDWRATATAIAVATLLAAQKYVSYEAARDPERTGRVPIARRPVNTIPSPSPNGAPGSTVTPLHRPRQPHEPTHR